MLNLRTLLSSLSWQSSSVVFKAICQLVVMAVLARHLNAEQFGIVAAANIVIMLVQMLTEAGAGSVLVQRSVIDPRIIAAATHISLLIGLAFALLIISISVYIAEYFVLPVLTEYVDILSISFVLVALYKVPESILQRNMRFDVLMKINLLSYVVGYACPALFLANKGYGAWAMVIGSLVQIAMKAALLCLAQPVQLLCFPRRSEYSEVLKFGLGVTSIRLWNYFYGQGDKFVLGRTMRTDGLGQYQLASQLAFLPGQYLGDILDAVLFPVMSRLREDRKKIGALLLTVQELTFFSMSSLGIFMASFGEDLIGLIYGKSWLSIVMVFQILCLGAGIRSATRIGDIGNRALGRLKAASASKMIAAIFLIVTVYFSSSRGLHGAALAVLTSNVLAWLLVSWVSMAGLGITVRAIVEALLRVVICSVLACLLIKCVHLISLMQIDSSIVRLLVVGPLSAVIVLAIGYKAYKLPVMKLKYTIFGKSKYE